MIDGVTFGRSKPIEEVTLVDILSHPIWMYAVDEETVEGQDETWTKPITSTTDVGDNIINFGPSLAFKVVGTEFYAFCVYYHRNRSVMPDFIWLDGRREHLSDIVDQRTVLREIEGLDYPAILEAIPTILGKPGLRFRLDPSDIFARRID